MARIVVNGAKQCPFCGCTKMYYKTFAVGQYRKTKYGASVQCSSCHVDGPKVYTCDLYGANCLLPFNQVSDGIIDNLRLDALLKWNERH